jgi:hypothetical protein
MGSPGTDRDRRGPPPGAWPQLDATCADAAAIFRRSRAGRRSAPLPARFSGSHRPQPLCRWPLCDFSFTSQSMARCLGRVNARLNQAETLPATDQRRELPCRESCRSPPACSVPDSSRATVRPLRTRNSGRFVARPRSNQTVSDPNKAPPPAEVAPCENPAGIPTAPIHNGPPARNRRTRGSAESPASRSPTRPDRGRSAASPSPSSAARWPCRGPDPRSASASQEWPRAHPG